MQGPVGCGFESRCGDKKTDPASHTPDAGKLNIEFVEIAEFVEFVDFIEFADCVRFAEIC